MSSQDIRPLAGRVALVTGATRGLGRACALLLAAAGAQVIAVGRTQGALEALDDEVRAIEAGQATLVPLDLTDGAAIDALGGEIFRRHRRLDVLVHAAGLLGRLRPAAHVPPDLWDRIVAVNLTSAWRLIRSFEPLLRQSDLARAVFVTDGITRQPLAFWGAYAAAKAGMEALVRAWADEMAHTSIRATLVDPGPMRTALRGEAFPGEDKEALPRPDAAAAFIVRLITAPQLGPAVDLRRVQLEGHGAAAAPEA